jgi:hypothetical protein
MSILPLSILSVGGDLSKSIATAIVTAVLNFESDLVKSLMKDVMSAVVASTSLSPSEGNNWFGPVVQQMVPVEELVVAPLLFAATIGAIIRQDMRRLARVWGAGLPLAGIGGYAVVQLANIGVGVTDALSSFVQHQVAPNLGANFLSAVTFGINNPAWGFVGNLISLIVLAGGLAIWLELAMRSAAVELAVFFMPLAFAGLVWPATSHWAKRLLEVLAALLLAKPVIVGALCLGDNAVTGANAGPSALVTGAAILLLAAFAPMALLKLVPVVEASAISHLQGLSRQPFHAADRYIQRAVAGVAAGAAGAGASAAAPASDSANQMLNQVGQDRGAEGHPLGPAQPRPPGTGSHGPSGPPPTPTPPVPAAPAAGG